VINNCSSAKGDDDFLPSCNMIRSLLRTSDACRAALGIAYGAPGKRTADRSHLASHRKPEATLSKTVQTTGEQGLLASTSSKSFAVASTAVCPSVVEAPLILGTNSHRDTQPDQLDQPRPAAVVTPVPSSPAMHDPEFRHSQSLEASTTAVPKMQMRASTVPSSRFGRLFQYGGAGFC
jgi:hypothetical protein